MWTKFMDSRGGLVLAGGFLALLLVCGGVVAWRALTGDGEPPPVAAPTTPPTTATTARCPTDRDDDVPTGPPPGVRWEAVGPVQLPFSATAGPCTVTASTATGYAHTPTGAVIAAAQITGRLNVSAAGESAALKTAKEQVLPGPARDLLIADLQRDDGDPLTEDEVGRVAAFAVASYSSDTAVINLALKGSAVAAQYVVLPTTVRWEGGDWRLVAPPGGSWQGSASVTSTLNGYIEWGPR